MIFRKAYERGEALTAMLSRYERPLLSLAHHDDEISVAGLLQRLGPRTAVRWLTNSDGLYFESDLRPAAYGELRKREGLRSLELAGLSPEQAGCLDFSEVEIYRRLAWLHAGERDIEAVWPFFEEIRQAVRREIFALRPDFVVTLAWQGGQPEHDLTHFFTRLALRDLERETGEKVPFFHFPAYEYTILIAQRFHPLYRGERVRLRLSEAEMATKRAMIEAYPSQTRLFGDFQRVFRWLGFIGRLTGGPASVEEYLTHEELGPVPEALDYSAKPHVSDRLTYMFDDFEGSPVTFAGSVRPIVVRALRDW